jgi:hypothetical protein
LRSLESLYLRSPTSFESVLLPTTFSSFFFLTVLLMNGFCPHIYADFIVFFPVYSNSDWRVGGFYKAGLAWVIWVVDGGAICPYSTVLV